MHTISPSPLKLLGVVTTLILTGNKIRTFRSTNNRVKQTLPKALNFLIQSQQDWQNFIIACSRVCKYKQGFSDQ